MHPLSLPVCCRFPTLKRVLNVTSIGKAVQSHFATGVLVGHFATDVDPALRLCRDKGCGCGSMASAAEAVHVGDENAASSSVGACGDGGDERGVSSVALRLREQSNLGVDGQRLSSLVRTVFRARRSVPHRPVLLVCMQMIKSIVDTKAALDAEEGTRFVSATLRHGLPSRPLMHAVVCV